MSRSATEEISITIQADEIYSRHAEAQDPEGLFEKASNWISKIQTTTLDDSKRDLINDEVHDSMARAIFGSNMIENAGLGYDITIQLCKRIFTDDDLSDIIKSDEFYQSALLDLYPQQPNQKEFTQSISRGRDEIVQHAKAYQHIIHAFVTEKQDLSEELIMDTHRILTTGIPIYVADALEIPPEQYGGIYRTVIVGAGTCNFTVPKFVPAKMEEMCNNLKRELSAAGEAKSIDPFSIAAKYSLQFVEIHPFQDGNGRMCRMILNAILCRYAGVIVPIGETPEERKEYMGIKQRASRDMEGHGEYATFVLRRSVTRLREMKKKLAGKTKGSNVPTSRACEEKPCSN